VGEYRRERQGVAAAMAGALILAAAGGLPAAAADSPGEPPSSALRASALFAWHLSPSLAALRTEINTRWPGRDRSSDGAIGDVRHQSRSNSHNPAGHPGGPAFGTRGAVHALDITAQGIDVQRVLRAVIGDPRVWYVIHDRRIWSRTTGWAPRAYRGDPHTTHLHINLREDSQAAALRAETDTRPWLTGGGARGTSVQVGAAAPGLAPGMSVSATKSLQRALIRSGYRIPSGPTGWYGPETTAAVRTFQRAQGWSGRGADGLAGPETLRRLGVSLAGGSSRSTAPTKARASKPSTSSRAAGTLGPGTSSRSVAALQRALIKRGYAIPAGATGYYGSLTKAAVKKFQRAQGWRGRGADGVAGPQTLSRLGVAGSASGSAKSKTSTKKPAKPTKSRSSSARAASSRTGSVSLANLKPGVAHKDVYALQQALISRGYAIPAGATGYYGSRTTAAVKKFQRAQGWSKSASDGIPGRTTLKRLGL
jgi:peptidoglycan hydrolase-like protein with peptidoglycan-binding domain